MQILNIEVANQLKHNLKAKTSLAYEFNKYVTTIDNWIRKNNEGKATHLTNPNSLKIISDELGVKKSELLTEYKVTV